jgi:hypothetical protein
MNAESRERIRQLAREAIAASEALRLDAATDSARLAAARRTELRIEREHQVALDELSRRR